jgi:hypothetical protein
MIEVGKIDSKIIGEEFLFFDYIKQPIKDSEVQSWRDQGYYHESFTGELYSSKNPMPEWTQKVAQGIGLKQCGFTFYKMNTLDIMPPHQDHFETYCKIFNVDQKEVFRAIVFIQDWKPGHYFEYNKIGFTNWNKGDYVMYSYDVEHAASNIGVEPRFTLQVTGLKD